MENFHLLYSRYFINHNAEEDRFFNIDANTGTIKTSKVLDREETPWYNITVTASENGNPALCISGNNVSVHGITGRDFLASKARPISLLSGFCRMYT